MVLLSTVIFVKSIHRCMSKSAGRRSDGTIAACSSCIFVATECPVVVSDHDAEPGPNQQGPSIGRFAGIF